MHRINLNLARVVEAWIDDEPSRALFYMSQNMTSATVDVGNLDAIRALQKRKRIHSFRWYLDQFAGRVFMLQMPHSPPASAQRIIAPLPAAAAHWLHNPWRLTPPPASSVAQPLFSIVVGRCGVKMLSVSFVFSLSFS